MPAKKEEIIIINNNKLKEGIYYNLPENAIHQDPSRSLDWRKRRLPISMTELEVGQDFLVLSATLEAKDLFVHHRYLCVQWNVHLDDRPFHQMPVPFPQPYLHQPTTPADEDQCLFQDRIAEKRRGNESEQYTLLSLA